MSHECESQIYDLERGNHSDHHHRHPQVPSSIHCPRNSVPLGQPRLLGLLSAVLGLSTCVSAARVVHRFDCHLSNQEQGCEHRSEVGAAVLRCDVLCACCCRHRHECVKVEGRASADPLYQKLCCGVLPKKHPPGLQHQSAMACSPG